MPGDDLDPDGRIPGCPPTWDLCWPVAELAACHDDVIGHMHHRGSQANSLYARALRLPPGKVPRDR